MTFAPEIPSLLLIAFFEAAMVVRDFGGGFATVVCPWASSGGEVEHAAFLTLTVTPPNVGKFTCAACGHKAVQEVLAALPLHVVARAFAIHVRLERPRTHDIGGGA